jgi:hypothetical protein
MVQIEFRGFLLSGLLLAAKNAPFYAHNKEKESRERETGSNQCLSLR